MNVDEGGAGGAGGGGGMLVWMMVSARYVSS